MKKIVYVLAATVLLLDAGAALAANTSAGQNSNKDEPSLATATSTVKAKNVAELKEQVLQKEQELEEELADKEAKEQKTYRNQNQVREAVHVLLAAEDLTNGLGQQISQIAREFNNSVEKTIEAENKIKERGWLKRLWAGGDKVAADEIEQEVKMNQGKVQQLLSLQENCQCSDEVKSLIDEQIQKIAAEQTRLEELSKDEKRAQGVWGWFKGLFGKDKAE